LLNTTTHKHIGSGSDARKANQGHASAVSRGPVRHQQRRSARELRERPDAGLGAIAHADYR